MNKKLLIWVLVAVAIIGAGIGFYFWNKKKKAAAEAAAISSKPAGSPVGDLENEYAAKMLTILDVDPNFKAQMFEQIKAKPEFSKMDAPTKLFTIVSHNIGANPEKRDTWETQAAEFVGTLYPILQEYRAKVGSANLLAPKV